MTDRREGKLATWAAILGAILPVVMGLIAFFWGQASAADSRMTALEVKAAEYGVVLKSIDRRLENIENLIQGKQK